MTAPVKTFLLTLVAGLALVGAAATPASAAAPCWNRLINDWVDGSIDRTYPTRCYQEAIRHIPPDVAIYSSAEDDFRRAMLLAFHTRDNGPGSGFGGGAAPATDRALAISDGEATSEKPGVFRRAIDWLGPSNAETIPTPLLVLAGIALLLLASAAASFLARRIQTRRAPAPATARGPKQP